VKAFFSDSYEVGIKGSPAPKGPNQLKQQADKAVMAEAKKGPSEVLFLAFDFLRSDGLEVKKIKISCPALAELAFAIEGVLCCFLQLKAGEFYDF